MAVVMMRAVKRIVALWHGFLFTSLALSEDLPDRDKLVTT
jgi:hypothetical protein